MRSIYKKLTYEDKFMRHMCCCGFRYIKKAKKANRKNARRFLKKEILLIKKEISYE